MIERRATRRLLAVLLLAFAGLASGHDAFAAAPARRALLIGVSDYRELPARSDGGSGPFDLEGPRNDVPRMIRAAHELGVDDRHLVVLANGLEDPKASRGEPTRAAIMGALADLARDAGAGDQVLVYFSGHGSQAPDLDGDEDDGLDEILLPSDIGHWQDTVQQVENAITDDAFGAAIQAIRDKGAFVWVIVDACHSGTALRGGPVVLESGMETKGAPPSAFGVPAARLQAARQTRGAGAARNGRDRIVPVGPVGPVAPGQGGVVAFYGAVAEEAAVGGPQPLPDGSNSPPVSLLTFAITEALAGGQVRTYRDLALQVGGYFDALGRRAPQPAFDGDFDRALFGHERVPPRRWAVTRTRDGYVADGGSLDGLRDGALLAVGDARAGQTAPIAYLRVVAAAPTSARLEPAAHGDIGADAARRLFAGAAYAGEQVEAGIPFQLSVARPAPGSPMASQVNAAIDGLAAGGSAADGIALRFVPAGQPADLHLLAAADRIWLSDVAAAPLAGTRSQPPSIAIAGDATAADLQAVLAGRLAAFARAQRVLAVMRALEAGAPATLGIAVHVDASRRRPEPRPCGPIAREPAAGAPTLEAFADAHAGVVQLRHCDVVYVTVRNTGDTPVDMTPLYFDRDFGISYLENGQLDGIRLLPGASRTYVAPIQTADVASGARMPLGLEQLVVVAVPRDSAQARPVSYAFLAQPPRPAGSRSAGGGPLDRLLDQAGFGAMPARSAGVGNVGAGTVRFSWMVGVD